MTDAQNAKASAPKVPMYFHDEAVKAAYRQHFVDRGGVPTMVDVSSPWSRPDARRAWRFPDGSLVVSDFAR